MKVKLNSGVEYWVGWSHFPNNITDEPHTVCQIQNETNKEIFLDAIAVLSTKDKYFIKDVGRKISMKKAMNAIGLNKETRKLFWIEYHKMTNKLTRIK